MPKTLLLAFLLFLGMGLPWGLGAKERLKVATTTSLYDTGLWGYLEPPVERNVGVELDVIATGTGTALQLGRRGDVDLLALHDKAREEEFVAQGYGVARVPFAYNYFLIIGPPSDPAGIKGLKPGEAMRRLFETGRGRFVSRGDESGTHAREKALWAAAGIPYQQVRKAPWYIESGMGMGQTLMLASQKGAYTLVDMGTFLAYKGKLDLVPLVDRGRELLNVYSAIAIHPKRHPKVNFGMAQRLIEFLTSSEGQRLIGQYGLKEYGRPLFFPCAHREPTR